jgi:hypothetical protein
MSMKSASTCILPRPQSRVQAMSRNRTWLVCAMLSLAMLSPLSAQGFGSAAASRQGFWYGGGLGQGYTDLWCGICAGERENGGISAYFKAGGTLTRSFLLGGELNAWRRSTGGLSEHLEVLTATGYWYPKPEHGWFVKFGLGMSNYRANDGDDHLSARIFAGTAGTGYEMRVSPILSIVPFLNLTATPNGNLNRENTGDGGFSAERVATDLKVFVIQFGVGITRH